MFELAQGCIMIASWVNCPLLAIEIFGCITYFRQFPDDVLAYKFAVIAALVIDIATVISVFAAIWMYTIAHWGDAAYQLSQPWPIPFYLFAVALSAAICQIYLAWRVYRFSRQWWLLVILAIPILGSVIGAFLTGQGAITVTLETRATLTFYVTLWLSFKAGADVMIAAACIWQLRRVKAVFGDTQSIIRRLSIQAVETGSITAVLAIAALILYNVLPNTNLSIMIAMVLGRIYSITMLANLNRRQATGMTASDELSRTNGGRSGFGALSGKQHGLGSKHGVAISRETHVNYDETPDHFDHIQPAAVIYRSKHDRATTPSQKTAADLTAWGQTPQGPGASDIELARGEPLRHA